MEIGPVSAIKRKGEPLITTYAFCITCQNVTKELSRKSSNEGKVVGLQKRRKLGDISSVILLDRIDTISDCEWDGDRLKWHKSCYSSFTSANHIKRLQKKYEKELSSIDDREIHLLHTENHRNLLISKSVCSVRKLTNKPFTILRL